MNNINGLISPTEAKELNDAYTSRHTLISNQITKKEDNRSSWFSLEELKAYLEHAEKQAKDLGYEMNGVRVYCGAYEAGEDSEINAEGLSTVFLIPTAAEDEGKGGGTGSNHDIEDADGLNKGGEGEPPSANYPQ